MKLLKTLNFKKFKKGKLNIIYIAALLLIAVIFRFYNLNWDQGHFFHPDERNIDMAVSSIAFFSEMNPKFFAYGGFSIYLYKAASLLIYFITKNSSWLYDWGSINLIGRFFSAFFSTLTIFPLYFLAKKISDRKVALLTIIFYVFSVGSIQTAHYGVTESLISLIVVSICLFSFLNFKKMTSLNTLLLGIFYGIGVATKTTSLIFLLIVISSFLSIFLTRKAKLLKIFNHFVFFLFTSFITFSIFSPYTFLSFDKFYESMIYESGVATGSLPVVYTLQFDKTIPYLFQIQNFFFQLGPVALFSLFGFIFVLYKALKEKGSKFFILSFFPLIYFLYVGSWHTKFIRYMVPLLPFLLIFASIFLFWIRTKKKLLGNFFIVFSIISSLLWSLAFFSIYTKPQTRITASEWIYNNIPTGSRILNEQWDDGLPLPLDDLTPNRYTITSLAMYDKDDLAKINYLSINLSNSDYIIFNSRRLYGTLINLNEKYPITSKYYKQLFSEKLGYKKVAEFGSYPTVFGLEINDDSSEETFQVYDHPKVIVFKNEGRLSNSDLKNLLKEDKL
ncbi:MAG: hypothetical protein A2152_03955 [Candidatus Levybacteria bacterium RBG_16_35_6]|nr:MAG: hypothetical protein A2152_03955 [Candidatus Levybacteria bacterium RBG_16_35_6]